MLQYQPSLKTINPESLLLTETIVPNAKEEAPPQLASLSLLERILRNSAPMRHKSSLGATTLAEADEPTLSSHLDGLDTASLHLTPMEALLVYAALENTAAAVEAERRRLAELLHSHVVESLNVLLSQTKSYEHTLGANQTTRTAISVLTSLVRQVLQQVHDLETNLYPTVLETLGLEPALETLVNQEMRDHGVQIILTVERMRERLPYQIELALFRVTQDTLYCAIRHAQASQVTIGLKRYNGQVNFNLADNGILVTGEDLLPATRQRIEQLGGTIETHIGRPRGFELAISFPLEAPVQFTFREMEVLQLLAESLSNKEIARLLSISPRTVNFHLDNIYSKLGVSSRTEAVIYALRRGWTRRNANVSLSIS
jgi:signal transduction histidine kinase